MTSRKRAGETVSHHMLRRTARDRLKVIHAEQQAALRAQTSVPGSFSGNHLLAEALDSLGRLGLNPGDTVTLTSTVRGPWGWRIVRTA